MMTNNTSLLGRYWDSIGVSWKPVLKPEFNKQYFINLCDFLTAEKEELQKIIYPPEKEVFAWTQYCRIEDVKVVIIGQDPYFMEGQAHGLSFSVKRPNTPPHSIRMIFRELENDIPGFKPPNYGDLTSWAEQGVLLLNSILTVRAGKSASHKNKGWEVFTDAVIRHLNDNYSGIVFMLWGQKAQMKKRLIGNENHLVMSCAHPSTLNRNNFFLGCQHFSQANKYLKQQRNTGIDWMISSVIPGQLSPMVGRDLRKIYWDSVGESWEPVLEPEFAEQYFIDLCDFLTQEEKEFPIYPCMEEVFSWTHYCRIQDVKIVIIGQDPYPEKGQSHGLSFSVKYPQTPPQRLQNIFDELKTQILDFKPPKHGDLTSWAAQGVLLLNLVPTVRAERPGSHEGKGWETFTDAVIEYLDKNRRGLVFMLWGADADRKGSLIDHDEYDSKKGKHCVLNWGDPSSEKKEFEGGDNFSKANEYLLENGKRQIDWKLYEGLRERYWDSVGKSWKRVFKPEFDEQYFINLCDFLMAEKEYNTIYPPEEEVFSWTRHCGIQDVKVVIIGQDPYPGEGQSHGLSFSVKYPQTPPPSLQMIYRELKTDITEFKLPNHGDLTSWAEQGVLLLNSCLTVRAGEPESHKDQGWEVFTDDLIRHLNNSCRGIVFMLWGVKAQKKRKFLDSEKHLVLCCGHPDLPHGYNMFLGCKHFSKANKYLEELEKGGINWHLPKKLG